MSYHVSHIFLYVFVIRIGIASPRCYLYFKVSFIPVLSLTTEVDNFLSMNFGKHVHKFRSKKWCILKSFTQHFSYDPTNYKPIQKGKQRHLRHQKSR